MEQKYRKVYVTMNLQVKPDGGIVPRSIIWEDGNRYKVDRVRCVTRAAAQKVGGFGDRYSLVIEGKERYFFCDPEDGRWFTEVPIYNTF